MAHREVVTTRMARGHLRYFVRYFVKLLCVTWRVWGMAWMRGRRSRMGSAWRGEKERGPL